MVEDGLSSDGLVGVSLPAAQRFSAKVLHEVVEWSFYSLVLCSHCGTALSTGMMSRCRFGAGGGVVSSRRLSWSWLTTVVGSGVAVAATASRPRSSCRSFW